MQSIYLRSCLVQLRMNTLFTSYNMRNEEQVNRYVHKLSGGKIQQQLVLKQLFYNFVSRRMYVSKHN